MMCCVCVCPVCARVQRAVCRVCVVSRVRMPRVSDCVCVCVCVFTCVCTCRTCAHMNGVDSLFGCPSHQPHFRAHRTLACADFPKRLTALYESLHRSPCSANVSTFHGPSRRLFRLALCERGLFLFVCVVCLRRGARERVALS